MEGTNPTVYIRLRKRVKLRSGQPVRLGHVAHLIVDPDKEAALKQIVLMRPDPRMVEQFALIDMLHIVRAVKALDPSLSVEYYGEPHVLVQWTKDEIVRKRRVLFPFVLFLLFIGSGLTIMNFHADVSMPAVHRKLYRLITGLDDPHPLILQVPYSLGLGVGMLLFFNRVFRKKLNEEPDPLEVEMYLYEDNVRQYLVSEEYRRMGEGDEVPRGDDEVKT
jgi:stage V sporulation protein AA